MMICNLIFFSSLPSNYKKKCVSVLYLTEGRKQWAASPPNRFQNSSDQCLTLLTMTKTLSFDSKGKKVPFLKSAVLRNEVSFQDKLNSRGFFLKTF